MEIRNERREGLNRKGRKRKTDASKTFQAWIMETLMNLFKTVL